MINAPNETTGANAGGPRQFPSAGQASTIEIVREAIRVLQQVEIDQILPLGIQNELLRRIKGYFSRCGLPT